MLILAAATAAADAGGVSLSPFLQYGVVGVIAMLGLSGMYQAYKREQKRADDANAEVARLNQAIIDKYLPSLAETAVLLGDVKELLRDWRGFKPPAGRRSSS